MSTKHADSVLAAALGGLPKTLVSRLIKEYIALRQAMSSGQYDSVGTRTGRFCETALRLLQQMLTGAHTAWSQKTLNLVNECQRLEQLPDKSGPESLRVIMPRAIVFAYTLRNKRGMGHVNAELDATEVDAATCVRVADWCICELIRLQSTVSLEEAQTLIDAIAVRTTPDVWSVLGRKRVLVAGLGYRDEVLLLLHSETESGVLEEDLREWVEHPKASNFRRDVLTPLHRARLIEYDRDSGAVMLSPSGANEVDQRLLPRLRSL